MFFEEDRIIAFREMIIAESAQERKTALAKILPYQQSDFEAMYTVLEGRPMTVRFLDPPLHEFLPQKEEDVLRLSQFSGVSVEKIKETIAFLHEANPMMGHRGCRLAVTYPEIAEMQTTAVINAALAVSGAHPEWNIVPEIMIPLTCEVKELKFVKDIVTKTADRLIAASGAKLTYHVGTMIEIPRAALTADEIAAEAEFFSFGTNDLTQMTYGFSRDDAGKFLQAYYDAKILEFDPAVKLDQDGVGKLVKLSAELGRKARPGIKLGVCGETGADPSSVEFFHSVGLHYVSCNPFRVPVARLAAAQAAIRSLEDKK
jgi:pyruvate,orthophosphate dikinase